MRAKSDARAASCISLVFLKLDTRGRSCTRIPLSQLYFGSFPVGLTMCNKSSNSKISISYRQTLVMFSLSELFQTPDDEWYSRSSQSSTSISPSVSISSTRLVVLEEAGFAAGCTSPLCSSCGSLDMAVGPLLGAWLSLGWTRGARGTRVRLGAARDSWFFE